MQKLNLSRDELKDIISKQDECGRGFQAEGRESLSLLLIRTL
jgi:hypothetical protein